ncbi:hypothetical protein [Paenibacillus montanisoli]|uniref:Uncharacterized protein n=1 Tax=Paenibacillus montanisoli TaxID=2081970 RepID=A0A328U3V8_9BACL|nr:hypothetical protein [Paenibacillus montanisoli]RAP77507.1 hypothetical protein DL346_03230 [Paenibacillus montanisoli]
MWINDEFEAGRYDLNWLGNYDEYGLNAIFIENYWNTGSPKVQSRYFDNLVISTERIGLAGAAKPGIGKALGHGK